MTEYTIESHIGTDCVLHLKIPHEWADQDVTVTIAPTQESESPKVNFAKTLIAKAGGCSFDVPVDIHERKYH